MTAHITIEGFEAMSLQQLFDISLAHVRKNGKPSVKVEDRLNELTGQPMESVVCSYAGIGCAAAPFIREDQREAADYLGITVSGCTWHNLCTRGVVPANNMDFVADLQHCHDITAATTIKSKVNPNFMSDFEERMRWLALQHVLIYTPPK